MFNIEKKKFSEKFIYKVTFILFCKKLDWYLLDKYCTGRFSAIGASFSYTGKTASFS